MGVRNGMDIVDIKLFLSIVDSNSITKAAETSHFSQSTVSYRLKLLEKELGVYLFQRNRGNRTLGLTLQGERFIPIARQWLSVYMDTQSLKFLPENVLTIGTVDSISSSLLPHVYRRVSQGDAPLHLRIMTHQSSEVYDLVENREADIGFVSVPFRRKNVVTTLRFLQKFYVVRYSDHPGPPRRISPESLDPRFEIYQDWGGEYRQWHENVWGPLSAYHAWIDTVSLLHHFLINEQYWSILPDTSLQQLMSNFRSVQIDELDIPQQHQRVCYVIRHAEPKASSKKSLEIFEAALAQHLSTLNKG